MTQNQINFASIEENKRHNAAEEELKAEQNKLTKKMNSETAKHYQRQDDINRSHYERSDSASLLGAQANMVSANANALNARTNQSKYQMEYDIEYGWTGDTRFPEGMPLSAQQKNMDLAYKDKKLPYELSVAESEAQVKKAQALNSLVNAFAGKGGVWGIVSDVLNIKSADPGSQYLDPENYYKVGTDIIYVGP